MSGKVKVRSHSYVGLSLRDMMTNAHRKECSDLSLPMPFEGVLALPM